jgi:hypothetical protein
MLFNYRQNITHIVTLKQQKKGKKITIIKKYMQLYSDFPLYSKTLI